MAKKYAHCTRASPPMPSAATKRSSRRVIASVPGRMTGPYFKSCNCDPGCPCDFMSEPTHHECEGILGMEIKEGTFDGVSLNGVKFAAAYHWPGPLHEGNGSMKPYFDAATSEEQM